jgi:hypothetical protein
MGQYITIFIEPKEDDGKSEPFTLPLSEMNRRVNAWLEKNEGKIFNVTQSIATIPANDNKATRVLCSIGYQSDILRNEE